MDEFTKFQKESDKNFLEEMKHQVNVDADLRKQTGGKFVCACATICAV
jgi:hypothetical protein